MNATTIKKLIDSLPDPHTYDKDMVCVQYLPEATITKGEIDSTKRIPTVEIYFRRVYGYYGHDWEFVDIMVLKS